MEVLLSKASRPSIHIEAFWIYLSHWSGARGTVWYELCKSLTDSALPYGVDNLHTPVKCEIESLASLAGLTLTAIRFTVRKQAPPTSLAANRLPWYYLVGCKRMFPDDFSALCLVLLFYFSPPIKAVHVRCMCVVTPL